MKVNIERPIKDAAKDMVKFYFENYHKNSNFDGLKNDLMKHIDSCKLDAFANSKGSKVTIKQSCKKRHQDPTQN